VCLNDLSSGVGWGWSSAAAHCGSAPAESWLGMELWRKRWSAAGWREYLEAGESQATLAAIRHNTHTGRPPGSAGSCAHGRADKAAPCFAKAWTQASGEAGTEAGNVFVWGLVEHVRVRGRAGFGDSAPTSDFHGGYSGRLANAPVPQIPKSLHHSFGFRSGNLLFTSTLSFWHTPAKS
jgi:hypothetical protein